jgi:hypothetical protein
MVLIGISLPWLDPPDGVDLAFGGYPVCESRAYGGRMNRVVTR